MTKIRSRNYIKPFYHLRDFLYLKNLFFFCTRSFYLCILFIFCSFYELIDVRMYFIKYIIQFRMKLFTVIDA